MPNQHFVPNPRDVLDLLEEEGLLIIHPKQVIDRKKFARLLNCCENTIDNRVKRAKEGLDSAFPKKRRTGENSVGWLAGEVLDYIDSLPVVPSETGDEER